VGQTFLNEFWHKKAFSLSFTFMNFYKNHITDGLILKGMECMGYKKKGRYYFINNATFKQRTQ